MSKPIILLYANVYETTVGQGQPYMRFLSQFGDVLLVTSEMDLKRMIDLGDILALPGGMDINPDTYGMRPGFDVKSINAHYEYLDKYLLKPWLKTGRPIIAICRGMQTLNVACGGTLHRHISGHQQSDEYHRWQTPFKMFTMLQNEKGQHTHPVVEINSMHHQCVREVAPGFEVVGWSDYVERDPTRKIGGFKAKKWYKPINSNEYKIGREVNMVPEIIAHRELPYIAFQYHPEESDCELAVSLIEETLHKYDTKKVKETPTKEKIGFGVKTPA